MPVEVASSAGFCFGVERAVTMLTKLLEHSDKVCTLGPIIHNPQVVQGFSQRGVQILDDITHTPIGYTVVIRSHGVGKDVYNYIEQNKIAFVDATCPYVGKIHRLVEQAAEQEKVVIIAGDHSHPEVQGIIKHCSGRCEVIGNHKELLNLMEIYSDLTESSLVFLAQTTFNLEEWQICVKIAKQLYTKLQIFDTICSATMMRQQQAYILSKRSDKMVVIGGGNSSNTAKLAQICSANCDTLLIETAKELKSEDFVGVLRIGVTAGASTPAFIIKEVRKKMSDFLNEQDEMSFEEMLEQSFKTINSKEKVTAVVTSVSAVEIAVDIGTKHAGYVPLHEYTDDPNAKLEELVKVGDEIELMVLRINDVEGTAMLSKKRLDAIAGFEKIIAAEISGEVLEGIVIDVVKGGVIAVTNGVRVFIPASQATVSRNQELESLLKQTVKFKIIEVNKPRHRAVASIRGVLKEQRKGLEDKFWQDVEVGKAYSGTVKSITSYGAFVDLGGIDGMVHISELSWNRIKAPSEIVSVGEVIEVYIKDIDAENKKISLGYKKNNDNPWVVLKEKFAVGDTVTAKVVSLTPFGAFAQVIPGVDGLIHISQISNERIAKPADALTVGQEVQAKLIDIDFDKKRVSLSMRALLEPEKSEQEDNTPATVYEAGPTSGEQAK